MNLLDWILVAILVLAVLNGYRRGATLQLLSYAGLLIGLLVGALIAPRIALLLHNPLSQATVALVVLLAAAGIGDALGWMLGSRVWRVTHRTRLGMADSVLGSVVALAAVLFTVWYVSLNLANGPFPGVSAEIRGSAIVQALDERLPRPPSVLAEVRQFLNRFGFPEVFADLPPAPAGPVQGPTRGEAARLATPALGSTIRVVGAACGGIQEGSGFVAAEHYVVTNAHVVAGVRAPEVQQQNGASQSATTVLYDPRLDVAVLYVKATPGPPLELDTRTEDRATPGAVLGYPGGGPLTFGPGAIRRELTAIGRDIYGGSIVERRVYELQAQVLPGNSGGPFVVAGGVVAGVVFAASTTDSDVGYAISSTEVIPKVDAASGRTRAVSTEGCAR